MGTVMGNRNVNKLKVMSKQNSVEWLYERLERMIPRTALYNIDKKQYFEQAKAMHKEETIKSNRDGVDMVVDK